LIDLENSEIDTLEESLASVSAQGRVLNEKGALSAQRIKELDIKVKSIAEDIESISRFRRTVNQRLLELDSSSGSVTQ